MEIKRNLLSDGKKSYFRFIIGLIFLTISILWIGAKIKKGEGVSFFDWMFFGVFTLNGISHLLAAFGFQIVELFGKAFVLIDDEQITLKTNVFKKEKSVLWTEVSKIDYHLNKLSVYKTDNTTVSLDLSEMSYALKAEIRNCIESISAGKQIAATV